MKHKYQAWKGSYIDHYFNHLDRGEWINISFLKYIMLKIGGYTVKVISK